MSTVLPMEAVSCERCGRCLSVCPVYDVERIETLSPRGRLDLIAGMESGELVPGARYREALFSCLQCLACTEACPKGVDAAERIVKARIRSITANRTGVRLERLWMRAVLKHRTWIAAVAWAASRVQRLLPDPTMPRSRHLPMFLPDMLAGRRIPEISGVNVSVGLPEVIPADPKVDFRGRVTLFTGCYFGFVETRPLLAAIRVLCHNGWEVQIPKIQGCCGAAALMAGHLDIARSMAVRNLAALVGNGPVLTACATCGRMVKQEYPVLFAEAKSSLEWRQATALAGRMDDVHGWLDRNGPLQPIQPIRPHRVTVHDPCHLARGQGVRGAVRRLLDRVPGVELVEMVDSDACCGGGGLSGMKRPELSLAVGAKKIASIEATGADTVVAGCPGCLMQIRDLLSRKRSPIQALHPLELIAWSCGLEAGGKEANG